MFLEVLAFKVFSLSVSSIYKTKFIKMATSTLKADSLLGRTSKREMSHMSKRPSVVTN